MAKHVGVFANVITFLEEGKETFSTFMKYSLCKHRSQQASLCGKCPYSSCLTDSPVFFLDVRMCQNRVQIRLGLPGETTVTMRLYNPQSNQAKKKEMKIK